MGFLDRFRNKGKKDVQKEEKQCLPYSISLNEEGKTVIEFFDNDADFKQFYDTTKLIIDKADKDYSECRVSWYNDDDVVFLDENGKEKQEGSRYDFRKILVGINFELLNSDPEYVVALMKNVLSKKNVEEYLEIGMQENPEKPCGKYVGEIVKGENGYKADFNTAIGFLSHTSEEMKEKRARRRELAEEAKKRKIERNKDEIEKLQAEIDGLEGRG